MIETDPQKALEKFDENLCIRCPEHIRGKCCHLNVWAGKEKRFKIFLENHACRYLNTESGWCTIYENRYKENPRCRSIEYAIEKGNLIKECLYVKDNKEYQARTDTVFYIDDIRDQLTERERLDYELTNASARRFITRY